MELTFLPSQLLPQTKLKSNKLPTRPGLVGAFSSLNQPISPNTSQEMAGSGFPFDIQLFHWKLTIVPSQLLPQTTYINSNKTASLPALVDHNSPLNWPSSPITGWDPAIYPFDFQHYNWKLMVVPSQLFRDPLIIECTGESPILARDPATFAFDFQRFHWNLTCIPS